MTAHSRSHWAVCPVCKQEFRTQKAKVCSKCYEKKRVNKKK